MIGEAAVWPLVRLGTVLKRSTETVEPNVETEYREITVRMWGRGVVERGRVLGAGVNGRRFVARAGQFIASRIDARNGAMGLVPDALDGALVTNDFPLFDVNTERLAPGYLQWLCRTASFVELCQRASEGTTNRVRLKEGEFIALEIPLPALPEQQRIAARIDEAATERTRALDLNLAAQREGDAIIGAVANQLFSASSDWPMQPLELLASIRSGVTLGRLLKGDTITLPYLRVANVQDGRLDLREVKQIDVLRSEAEKWSLEPGDLLLTEGGDWDKLGRCALWSGEIADCIHQNHIFCVRPNNRVVLPRYLARLIGSPVGKTYFQSCAKQTTNLASINQRQLRALPVAHPPLDTQHRIVAELDALQAEVDSLKKVQAQTRAELDALLPAILDRAFAGAL